MRMFLLRFDFAGVTRSDARNCTMTWKKSSNTLLFGWPLNSVRTLDECKQVCIKNASCTGINYSHEKERFRKKPRLFPWDVHFDTYRAESRYYDGIDQCSIAGPWSGARMTANYTHYYGLTRNCPGGQKHIECIAIDKNVKCT